MDLSPVASDVLRAPPSARFAFVTMIIAVLLYLIPPTGTWMMVRPDLPLVVLLYWSIHQPRYGGFLIAFLLGLVIDVVDGHVLGQHAIAYCVAVYLALALRLRVLKFAFWQQALHVVGMLLAAQAVLALTNFFLPTVFPGFAYFLGSVTGAIFWLPIAYAIEYVQAQAAARREA